MEQDTRILEPVPAEDEIRITATPWLDEVSEVRGGARSTAAAASATSSTASRSTPPRPPPLPGPGRRLGGRAARVRPLRPHRVS